VNPEWIFVTKLSTHGGLSGQVPNLGTFLDKCPWALFRGKMVEYLGMKID